METVGTMCEGEWSSFGGMFSSEEANFMSQFIGNYSFPTDSTCLETSPAFWPSQEPVTNAVAFDENLYYVQDNAYSYSYSSNDSFFPTAIGEENYDLTDNSFNPMGFFTTEQQNPRYMDIVIPDNACLSSGSFGDSEGGSPQNAVTVPDPKSQLKRKPDAIQQNASPANDDSTPSENPKKKARVSGSVAKSKKNAMSKKNQGTTESSKNEEGNSSDMNGQSSSSYTSEDDIVPQESEATDTKCKTRAGRGSATDPQSIYARKRRERINERLRILQNLVPNGTKVDISTMLEEAVQYVKFLQVQIKLLSSDDLWMYAPLAYNGMDIGLDHKITLPR